MNTQEANKFIELMGGKRCYDLPYNEGSTRNGRVSTYFYNGFCVYFSGTYYFVVNGKFPAKIADQIAKKAMQLKIRIDGGCEEWSVKSRLGHDKLKGLCYDWSDPKGCEKRYKEIREDVLANDYDNCYIQTYHIDTVDGLKYVLDIIRENDVKTQWFTESYV